MALARLLAVVSLVLGTPALAADPQPAATGGVGSRRARADRAGRRDASRLRDADRQLHPVALRS